MIEKTVVVYLPNPEAYARSRRRWAACLSVAIAAALVAVVAAAVAGEWMGLAFQVVLTGFLTAMLRGTVRDYREARNEADRRLASQVLES